MATDNLADYGLPVTFGKRKQCFDLKRSRLQRSKDNLKAKNAASRRKACIHARSVKLSELFKSKSDPIHKQGLPEGGGRPASSSNKTAGGNSKYPGSRDNRDVCQRLSNPRNQLDSLSKMSEYSSSDRVSGNNRCSQIKFPTHLVAAPMVGASDLAFRILCRRHGTQVCYTEMLCSTRLCHHSEGAKYKETYFKTCNQDRPLVVQLSGNDPKNILTAGLMLQNECDAIDLNLGCPQLHARRNLYGAYLLEREHWPLVQKIVSKLAGALKIPVFCKIRLLPSLDDSVKFAQLLEAAGCSLLAVHGRTCSPSNGHKRRRKGPANLEAIARIVAAVSIPVLSNGNIRVRTDVIRAARITQASGVMSACGLLANPALFEDGDIAEFNSTPASRAKLLQLGLEYLRLFDEFPAPSFDYARAHVNYFLGKRREGSRLRYRQNWRHAFKSASHLRDAIAACRDTSELAKVMRTVLDTTYNNQTAPLTSEAKSGAFIKNKKLS